MNYHPSSGIEVEIAIKRQWPLARTAPYLWHRCGNTEHGAVLRLQTAKNIKCLTTKQNETSERLLPLLAA